MSTNEVDEGTRQGSNSAPSQPNAARSPGIDTAVDKDALKARNEHLAQQVEALTGQNERLVAALRAQGAERNQLATTVTEQARAIAHLQARFDRVAGQLERLDDDWSARADLEGASASFNGFAAATTESDSGFGGDRDEMGR